jgi:HSP20 family protein
MAEQAQILPVRVYQTGNRIMVAAPMPGLEPQDIRITVDGDRVAIRGELRGPHQHERDLRLSEWAVGPYYREVDLSEPVNGVLANATYGNGVLVVSIPKMPSGQPGTRAEFRLEGIDSTRGERVGHAGRDARPLTTREHRRDKHGADGRPPENETAHAHVNIWRLGPDDDPEDHSAAHLVGQRLRVERGFRSYTVIRTGPREVVAVTVFDSEAALEAALRSVTGVVRERVHPLAAGQPEHRAGPVLHHAEGPGSGAA